MLALLGPMYDVANGFPPEVIDVTDSHRSCNTYGNYVLITAIARNRTQDTRRPIRISRPSLHYGQEWSLQDGLLQGRHVYRRGPLSKESDVVPSRRQQRTYQSCTSCSCIFIYTQEWNPDSMRCLRSLIINCMDVDDQPVRI